MFVVLVERALHGVQPVGPFPHMEDAKDWAEAHLGIDPKSKVFIPHIFRVSEVVSPDQYKP